MNLHELKQAGEAPVWMTEAGYKTIRNSDGYLLPDETPKQAYYRIASTAAKALGQNVQKDTDDFFQAMWNNWLCPATPVYSNMGTDRGFPISCFGQDIQDDLSDIKLGLHEQGMMTKGGGGVGTSLNRIRGRGALIRGGLNGKSEGIIPWAKEYEVGIISTGQGGSRKGAGSINLNVRHTDFPEFLRMRRPNGDVNRVCRQINHCAVIPDEFMRSVLDGNTEDQMTWIEIMKTRLETGEPYIMYEDTINRANPSNFKELGLHVSMTNICTEITLPTDALHSFVCCLSSLNFYRWDEWKNKGIVKLAIRFLNGVLNEFINQAKGAIGLEKAVRFAEKSRAIGIGGLGWHSLLQSRMIAFDSFDAMMLNSEIWKHINEEADAASRELAEEFGEPEWCKGTGRYNTHLIAQAPTRSNSIIAGDMSFGIEPYVANAYSDQTAQGIFIRKNRQLEIVLEALGKNDLETWKSIVENEGSVQHLDFLTAQEKQVFLTAYELNQMAIIKQASQRQKYIDQAQSINLFFYPDVNPKYFSDVHIEAWKLGVKTLYYVRSDSVYRADVASREGKREVFNPDINECAACEG